MKTVLKFNLDGKKVKIEENAVFCSDLVLNQKIVNWFIHCRMATETSKEAMMMLFNQYLRFMSVSNIQFDQVREDNYIVPEFIEQAIYAEQHAA